VAKAIRDFWGLTGESQLLLQEDLCPSHAGLKDQRTKENDLKAKRIVQLQKIGVRRALTPKKGNPNYGVNDQIHKNLHRDIRTEIFKRIGLQRKAQKRPRGAALKPGGKHVTPAGMRRGPTAYQFADAVNTVFQSFDALVSDAAFVACGWLTRADLISMGRSASDFLQGKALLKKQQAEVHKKRRPNEAHDFSGTTPAQRK